MKYEQEFVGMTAVKYVGRSAPALKYDLITALGAYALAGSPGDQRQALRFTTLLTARYNWARDELAVGQREIARLWSCNERTVKREMARFRGMGWLILKRQGARGRVACYGLSIPTLLDTTRPHWAAVGHDFEERQAAPDQNLSSTNVVPLRLKTPRAVLPIDDSSEWGRICIGLQSLDPDSYATWLSTLVCRGRSSDRLVLEAPSRFHASYVSSHLLPRIERMCRLVDPRIEGVQIIGPSQ